jgi:hypothetical protein
MRTGRVSIFRENAFGIMNNIKVDVETLQHLEFPNKTGVLGSYVVWVVENFKKQPFIIGVLNKDGSFLAAKENQRLFTKKSKKGSVSVSLDGNNVSIDIVSEGEAATVNVICRGGDVNLKSDKNVFVEAVKSVDVQTQGSVSIRQEDEEGKTELKIEKGVVSINSEKINHNSAEQPMLRGDKAVELLNELIDLLFKARVATSIGLQPLTTIVEINELKSKLNDLKSTKSFLE